MKDIYDKIDIPEPSADLEAKIIAQTAASNKKYLFPKLAVIAACFVIVIGVWSKNPTAVKPQNNILISADELLYDIEFFEEDTYFDESFYEELS